ncbi:conjugative transposon protein TraM [Daejeonella sp. JGW-45]|uniref:conjugative transposon protein TraM n=1 Tax=Daejeonella sp. JGW-45 TaxID=3034148 RepID=UPI0023EC63C6|nr:conjugative transposon protein TraM [Daejeonella sp. JGW-45]
MKTIHSQAYLRHRKFLLVLPLLITPFLTMAFWALGGGQTRNAEHGASLETRGINTALPEAKFTGNEKDDKLSAYEASLKELNNSSWGDSVGEYSSQPGFDALTSNPADQQEAEIRQRLALLQQEINRPQAPTSSPSRNVSRSSSISGDVNRLESLMQSIQTGGDDPEMKQLNAVLEKIMDIQNPGLAKERLKLTSAKSKGQVFAVQQATQGASNQNTLESVAGNAVNAVIHQDQDIVSGSVIKLRLSDSIYVAGRLIPKNEFLFGIAAVEGERLKINIATLRYRNAILPVALSAYDLDGLEGLYIPGAITRDAIKSGTEEAIQSLQVLSMDPSVSAQVAGAGIQAAKGLFSKKAKQVRVKVKAGYKLLLRDNNQRNN